MPLRDKLFLLSVITSTICLAGGFVLAERWYLVLFALLSLIAWLLAKKYSTFWLPPGCLILSICLAVVGVLVGASPVQMILGSTTALASWDLVLLVHSLESSSQEGESRLFEKKRAQYLAFALGTGLMLAVIGRFFSFQAPFGLMVVMVIVTLYSLERSWRFIKK